MSANPSRCRFAPSRIRRRICSPSSMRFMMKRGRRAFRPANSPDARKALRARTTIGTDLVSVLRGLFRFEADFLEHLRLAVKLRLPGRELVDVQQESQDVGVLLSRQTARLALRHGFADAVEKIAETKAIRFGLKRAASQRRRGLASREHVAVAGGALLLIDLFAT